MGLRPQLPAHRGSLVAVLFVVVAMFFGTAVPAYADVNNFTIQHFNADETLSRSDKQGSLHINETITVLFTDNHHGLLRSIPEMYNKQPLLLHNIHVSSPSGAPANVSTNSQNGNTVLQIGDATHTVTGKQTYVISYDLDNVVNFYPDHDELYWDVNGDQWKQADLLVDYTLHLPAGVKLSSNKVHCFTGYYGATTSNCTITAEGSTIKASAARLDGNQTLTIVAGFQKGYFVPPTLFEKIQPYILMILLVTLLPLLTFIICWRLWWTRGRDPRGRGTIIPEYMPPKDVTATEAGALIDFKVDNRDITAAIIDLALRGYIRIIEAKHYRAAGEDRTKYQLELLKNDTTALNYYEQPLLSALFPNNSVGEKMEIAGSGKTFYGTANAIRTSVKDSLNKRGYFRSTPDSYLKVGGAVAVVGLLTFHTIWLLELKFLGILIPAFIVWMFVRVMPHDSGVFRSRPRSYLIIGSAFAVVGVLTYFFSALLEPLGVGIVLSAIIAWIFIRAMPSRTQLGVDAKEKIEGLKLYIETAEKDRIEKLQSPDAPYAAQSAEPVKTVELFEKLLPYAIALGIEKQWAKQFEDIYYDEQPGWYVGNNWSHVNSVALVNSLNGGFQHNINTAFTPSGSSSSSGFGGGGFAGGGGGGGGGGGW